MDVTTDRQTQNDAVLKEGKCHFFRTGHSGMAVAVSGKYYQVNGLLTTVSRLEGHVSNDANGGDDGRGDGGKADDGKADHNL